MFRSADAVGVAQAALALPTVSAVVDWAGPDDRLVPLRDDDQGRGVSERWCNWELVVLEWERKRISEQEHNELETFIREELAKLDHENQSERTRQRLRIEQLKAERHKLLQAHYADAVPLDLFKSEQQRVSHELEGAEALMCRASAEVSKVAITVGHALRLVVDCGSTYEAAPARQRRQMNQGLYSKLLVGDDGTIEAEYTEEYQLLLDPSLRDSAHKAQQVSRPVVAPHRLNGRPLNGVEPTHSWNRQRFGKCKTPAFAGRGSKEALLVDLTALFLNYVPPCQTADSLSVLPVDEPLDGVVQTGPVQRQNRLEETKILELVASYVAGMSIAALARQFEINETTVRAHLARQQVERRQYRKVTPAQLQEAIELYEGGMSMRGVARHLGVAQDTATRLLVEAGVRKSR